MKIILDLIKNSQKKMEKIIFINNLGKKDTKTQILNVTKICMK